MERRRILVVAAALVAVLGAVLVLLYVRGSDDRAQDKYALTRVLVATSQIAAGESFGEASDQGKIDVAQVVTADVLAQAATDASQIDRDEVAQTPIYPGEQILPQKWGAVSTLPDQATTTLAIPDGDIAISVSLTDPGRVAGFVNQGSHVTVFATTPTYSKVLLPDVLVLGVGSTALTNGSTPVAGASTDGGQSGLPSTLLTVAVSQAQAQKILLAQSTTPVNTLAFGLLTDNSKVQRGTTADPGNLFQ
jgi:pilus assembly protein CpaB